MIRSRYTFLYAALCTVFALLGPALVLASQAASAPGAEAGAWLLIGPPGADLAAIALAAGGWVIGFGQAPMAILAAGPANFDTLSEAQGAWITIKASGLADICGVSYETTAG